MSPYTKNTDRERYFPLAEVLKTTRIYSAADLAYIITQVIDQYVDQREMCWETLSNASKAVESAHEAFMDDVYRPYERNKRNINGEVFT